MFNKKKKIIYSLMAITILSSSAANAANYNYSSGYNNYSRDYNNYYGYDNSRYDNNYYKASNIEQNTVVDKYPTFTWEVVNVWPSKPSQPSKPTPPVNNLPETPTYNPDYNWGNSNNKPGPSKPEVPVEKPAEPVAPKPTPPASGVSSIEMEVIRLVNIERQKEGLSPLVASSALSNVARKKSEDMAVNNYFSHTSPTYGSSSNMMKTFGINSSYSGENIAKGQLSAQSVVRAWMNSSGHRDNIMNPSFKTIGVGHYQSSNGTNLWTQMFTN